LSILRWTVRPFDVEGNSNLYSEFTMIEARDLNEAIQIASKFPAARLGSMEVRPVLESDGVLASPLDQKIGAAFSRSASKVEPSAAARIASIPQP
jgi:hypothetical protein